MAIEFVDSMGVLWYVLRWRKKARTQQELGACSVSEKTGGGYLRINGWGACGSSADTKRGTCRYPTNLEVFRQAQTLRISFLANEMSSQMDLPLDMQHSSDHDSLFDNNADVTSLPFD